MNVTLIVLFNYYYTFLQLDPKDMADQLKRAGGAIPAVRPGRATADYITKTLNRMSILGSAFLGALAAAPPLVETVTGLQVLLSRVYSNIHICREPLVLLREALCAPWMVPSLCRAVAILQCLLLERQVDVVQDALRHLEDRDQLPDQITMHWSMHCAEG